MDIKKMPEIKNISKIGKEKILLLALAGIMGLTISASKTMPAKSFIYFLLLLSGNIFKTREITSEKIHIFFIY